jgi:hypothetical protein
MTVTAGLPPLTLYRRDGCCLCDGLEQRLRELEPRPELVLVDVASDPALEARYGLEIPVLAVVMAHQLQELPRVSPRLSGAALDRWLRKCLAALSDAPESA